MIIAEKQIKSRFTENITDLAGEIINELMDAETIDLSNPEARAEVSNAINAVFDRYDADADGKKAVI